MQRRLARQLGRADWIVVDCRFTLTDPPAGRAAYGRGHIPGARYAHLDDDLARSPSATRDGIRCPSAIDSPRRSAAWGIGADDTVVAYDEGSGAIAARLWWMLRWLGHERCAVLDGGFAAWDAAGFDVEQGTPAFAARRYTPRGRCTRRRRRDRRARRPPSRRRPARRCARCPAL